LPPRGAFIGVASSAHYREPFLFNPPLIPLPDEVDDAEATESLKPLNAIPTVFAEEFRHWQPVPVVQVRDRGAADDLTETERRFVNAVVALPG